MTEGGQTTELVRALLDPRVAWATARRGDPRPGWWFCFGVGLLAMMGLSAGAFLIVQRLLSRVVETQPTGLLPLVLTVLGFFFLAAACAYFALIWVAAISRVLDH